MTQKNYFQLLTVVLLVILLGACSVDPQTGKQKYLQSGIHYLDKHKYPEAVIQFRNALKLDPQYTDGYYQLGRAYLATRDWRDAYMAFQQASTLDPSRTDAHLALARLYLASRQHEQVEQETSVILQRDPRNPDAYALLGTSYMIRGMQAQGREAFAKAVELAPQQAPGYINLALSEVALKDYGNAESHFRKAIEIDPAFNEAYSNLANLYRLQGDAPRAEQVLQEGIQHSHNATLLYLAWAELLDAQQKRDAAAAVLAKLQAGQPKSVPVALAIGDFYFMRQEWDPATVQYRLASTLDQKNTDAKARIVECHLAAGRIAEAQKLNAEILHSRPKNVAANIAKARILMAGRKFDEAVAQLRSVVSQAQDSPEAHYYLAAACQRIYNLPQAKTELLEALRLAPKWALATYALESLHLALGELPAAKALAEQAINDSPTNVPQRLLLGSVLARQGDAVNAEKQFLLARQLAPREPAVAIQLANLYSARQKWPQAEKEFEMALALNPRSTSALEQFASYCVLRNQRPRAISRVQQYVAANSNDVRAHILLGSLYSDSQSYENARLELQRALQLDPTQLSAYTLLANVYEHLNQLDEAIRAYENAATVDPRRAAMRIMLGSLYSQKGDRKAAKDAYEKAMALDPNSAVAANNLAWLYASDGGNLDVALSLAQKAKELQPDLVSATDTLGWIQYMKGLYAGAVPLLQECVGKAPQSPVYHYHLGMALLANGQKTQSKSQLQAALKLKLGGEEAHRAQRALGTLD